MQSLLLDAAGRRRSPATVPGYHRGRPPRNKGRRYPADPPTVEEIVAVMRTARYQPEGVRLRGLMLVLWRSGLRISEALALAESDLDWNRGAILVRRGKGGRRREVGMDRWAWDQLSPWLELRAALPVGALFCVVQVRRAVAPGLPRPLEPSCAVSPRPPAFGAASRPTSCATRTPLRWREKVCHWW
jgi:integrase